MCRRFIICLLPFLAACTKSSKTTPVTTPPFSVSANINGTPTTFNLFVTVDSLSTPGTVYIVAHSDSANLTPLLEITLTGGHPLEPGLYISPGNTPDSIADSTVISGLIGYTGWQGDTADQYTPITDTVNLTTVNSTWLAGTFSGTCVYADSAVVTVSNGQFAVGWNQR